MSSRPAASSVPAAGSGLTTFVAGELDRAELIRLARGEIGALRVTSFLPAERVRHLVEAVDRSIFDRYNPGRYDPPSAHFGPVINEFPERGLSEEYWLQVDRARGFWHARSPEQDIRSACLAKLSDAWGGLVSAATAGGRAIFWGMIRDTSEGTLIHWDDVMHEPARDLLDITPKVQLAFNFFLTVPPHGGETMIWNHRWHAADEQYRNGYGYRAEVLAAEKPLLVRPSLADAIFFDPRNYHGVRKGEGGSRIALSFFVGITNDGHLIVWS